MSTKATGIRLISSLRTKKISNKKTSLLTVGGLLSSPAYNTLVSSYTGTVYYISDVYGSDSNDGLSVASALKTIDQFNTLTSAITTAIMAVILPGYYNVTPVTNSASTTSASFCLNDHGYERKYVGYGGQTFLSWDAPTPPRDAAVVCFANSNSAAYGLIFKRNNNGRTANYSVAFFNHNGTNAFAGDLYNCAIEETNGELQGAPDNWSVGYANSGFPAGVSVNYCTIVGWEAAMADYSGDADLVFNNCVFNYAHGSSSATYNSCQNGVSGISYNQYIPYDAVTSGVYYGTYAWPAQTNNFYSRPIYVV